MDYTHPQYHPQLKQLAQQIDDLDYYQILNLPQTCTVAEIKQTYFSQSRALHPDAFYHLPDKVLKDAIHKIFKRVTEAYVILKDSQKRVAYTDGINGEARAKCLRYNEVSENKTAAKERKAREVCSTPKGKELFRQAQIAIQGGKLDSAFRHLQSIILYEPQNKRIIQLKDEINKRRKKKS